jgi:acetylornithine aminotransferase
LRILPPLSITKEDVDTFFAGLKNALATITVEANAEP